MRATTRRRVGALVSLALLLGVSAGCGTGPNRAGAAAFVGDTRISVTEVQTRLRQTMRAEPALEQRLRESEQLDDLGRDLAARLVRRELVERAGAAEGLRVPASRVRRFIDNAGGADQLARDTAYQREHLAEAVRTELLTLDLGRKYYAGLAVSFDMTRVDTRERAQQLAQQLARGKPGLADAPNPGGERVPAELPMRHVSGLHPAQTPELAAETPLFAAEPGTAVAFEPHSGTGEWLVARITGRETRAGPAPGVHPADEQLLNRFGQHLLAITAARTGVTMSPRYGAWDPVAGTVVAGMEQRHGFLVTPSPGAAVAE